MASHTKVGVSNWGGFVAYPYFPTGEIWTHTKNLASGKKGCLIVGVNY